MSTAPTRQLVTVNGGVRALAEAETLQDIKAVRDKAEAVRTYARTARVGLEVQNQAAELKLRAERKAGRLLASLRLHGGDRRSRRAQHRAKLELLGISPDESRRWQLLATVPERVFEKYFATTQTLGEEIAAAPLLRLARKLKRAGGTARSLRAASDNGTAKNDTSEVSHESTATRPATKVVPVSQEIPVPQEIIEDLANHCGTLVGLVASTPTSPEPDLTPKQLHYLRNTLNEMAAILESVRPI